jgi:AcrR family transcriptional regulator
VQEPGRWGVEGSTRPDPERADKRARILAAARAVLADRDYDTASMAEVAERAGVAKGTVYLYFPSKAALITELSANVRAQLLRAVGAEVGAGGPLVDRLPAMIRAGVAVAAEYGDVVRLLDIEMLLFRTPHEHPVPAGAGPLVDMLARARTAGEIDPDIDPEVAANLVSGVLLRLARTTLLELVDDSERRTEYVEQTIRFLLRALGTVPMSCTPQP